LGTAIGTDRRTAIADAAIEILGSSGSRALTHRAVDRHLGIAEGSTSRYHRTRDALVMAAAERISSLDLQAVVEGLTPHPKSLTQVAHELAELVAEAALPENRQRHRARYALIVESTSNPDLRATFLEVTGPVLSVTIPMFRDLGAKDPELGAAALALYINGLIMGLVTGPGDGPQLISIDELNDLMERFLRGF
jgi:DNA-binding transcriptional regulator YbjK